MHILYSNTQRTTNIIKFTYIDKLSNYFPINNNHINPNNESGERKKEEKNNFPPDHTPIMRVSLLWGRRSTAENTENGGIEKPDD